MSENSHMNYAFRIADHVSSCFVTLQSTCELMGLSLTVDDEVVDFASFADIWESVRLKIASNSSEAFSSIVNPIKTIFTKFGKAMLNCYEGYELDSTFAFYEMCFEIFVNIFVLLQNVRDAPNQPSHIVKTASQVVTQVNEQMLQVLEDIEEIHDSLLTFIPSKEHSFPGISGNLRLYMLELIVEIFGAESVRGRDLMDLTSNDVVGCVSLISFVIGHDGAPFRVQQAAAKALVELTFAETVFLSGVAAEIASGEENQSSRKIAEQITAAIDSMNGNADFNGQPISKMTALLKVHVNRLIQSIIQYDVIAAFTKCICVHQQSHWRTDILIQALLTTIHNCLLYCSDHADHLRRHLGVQSGIIPTILLPYIDNLLPALEETAAKNIATQKELQSEGSHLTELVRAGREMTAALEWRNFKSTLQSLVVASYSVSEMANEIVMSGILGRMCNDDEKIVILYLGDVAILEALVKLLVNCKFASSSTIDKNQRQIIKNGLKAIHSALNPRDLVKLNKKLSSTPENINQSLLQAQPWKILKKDGLCLSSLDSVSMFISSPASTSSVPISTPAVQQIIEAAEKNEKEKASKGKQAIVVQQLNAIAGLLVDNNLRKQDEKLDSSSITSSMDNISKFGVAGAAPEVQQIERQRAVEEFVSASLTIKESTTNNNTSLPSISTAKKSNAKTSNSSTIVSNINRSLIDAPPEFLCTLDGKLMTDPVRGLDDYAFERSTLYKWFDRCGQICPVTNKPLSKADLIEDEKLKMKINEWLAGRN
eukprot:GDKJ01003224.1.p1 GENE.GDKJ01003224.1~~GDKJ01003224.1.p1  ORF type:complete len:768 (+),score=170.76 GDKJ01003224.1:40-2343(+)